MEAKLQSMKAAQSGNTAKFMSGLAAENDKNLLVLTFKAIVDFHNEYQKNKELEDLVKVQEKQMAYFLKNKAEGAKQLLSAIAGGSESVLIKNGFDGWKQVWADAKKEAELAEALAAAESKFSSFNGRNKKGAHSVSEKKRQMEEGMTYLIILGLWRQQTRVEQALRQHHGKVDAKRQQLVGVQHMFRNFATQLEQGLKQGQDTDRDFRDGPPARKQRMHKNDGSVSLPDINQKQSGRSGVQSTPKSSGARKQADGYPPA